jgi:hypothetical protein
VKSLSVLSIFKSLLPTCGTIESRSSPGKPCML